MLAVERIDELGAELQINRVIRMTAMTVPDRLAALSERITALTGRTLSRDEVMAVVGRAFEHNIDLEHDGHLRALLGGLASASFGNGAPPHPPQAAPNATRAPAPQPADLKTKSPTRRAGLVVGGILVALSPVVMFASQTADFLIRDTRDPSLPGPAQGIGTWTLWSVVLWLGLAVAFGLIAHSMGATAPSARGLAVTTAAAALASAVAALAAAPIVNALPEIAAAALIVAPSAVFGVAVLVLAVNGRPIFRKFGLITGVGYGVLETLHIITWFVFGIEASGPLFMLSLVFLTLFGIAVSVGRTAPAVPSPGAQPQAMPVARRPVQSEAGASLQPPPEPPAHRGPSSNRKWLLRTVGIIGAVALVAALASAGVYFVRDHGSKSASVESPVLPVNTITATIPVGKGVKSIALSRDGKTVYATNSSDGTLSVIDTASNAVTGTIPVGMHPAGIAISADSNTAYVANSGAKSISVVDLGAKVITDTIAISGDPEGIALSPDGATAYTANNSAGTVSVIDLTAKKEAKVMGKGDSPAEVAVAPNGTAFVTYSMEDDVVTLVPDEGFTNHVGVGRHPRGIAAAPDRDIVYAVSTLDSTLTVIDASSRTVLATVALKGVSNAKDVAVSPDGTTAYVTGGYGIGVVDLTTNSMSRTIPVEDDYGPVAVSPDGKTVYAVSMLHNTISVLQHR